METATQQQRSKLKENIGYDLSLIHLLCNRARAKERREREGHIFDFVQDWIYIRFGRQKCHHQN